MSILMKCTVSLKSVKNLVHENKIYDDFYVPLYLIGSIL